jgi:hypothetical protein
MSDEQGQAPPTEEYPRPPIQPVPNVVLTSLQSTKDGKSLVEWEIADCTGSKYVYLDLPTAAQVCEHLFEAIITAAPEVIDDLQQVIANVADQVRAKMGGLMVPKNEIILPPGASPNGTADVTDINRQVR